MTVRELIAELNTVDPDAEVMVDSRGILLPTIRVTTGRFHSGNHLGPWIMVVGCEAWKQYAPSERIEPPPPNTPCPTCSRPTYVNAHRDLECSRCGPLT